ncbi:hypothetical protein KAU33_06650 [Candidatus Dependentiae bacterium]|nr:hypothetical protein [Candidatus Dependentiae bacterium]
MKRLFRVLSVIVSLVFILVSCENVNNPIEPEGLSSHDPIVTDRGVEKPFKLVTFYGVVVEKLGAKPVSGIPNVEIAATVIVPEDNTTFIVTATTNKRGYYSLTVSYPKPIANCTIILAPNNLEVVHGYKIVFVNGIPLGYYEYYQKRERIRFNFWTE